MADREWHTVCAHACGCVRSDVNRPQGYAGTESGDGAWITIQIVAFPQEGILSYPNGEALLEEALRLGADVVGAIPHFEFTREYGVESLHKAFALANRYDRLVDVHCDEIDDEQSRFVETVAALAHRDGMGARVTASHTTAMHSYNGAYTSRLFRLLKLSGINFVANPLVNIHLQGRFDSYPKRRGITRVKELLEAEINVCFGHDDVFDPGIRWVRAICFRCCIWDYMCVS